MSCWLNSVFSKRKLEFLKREAELETPNLYYGNYFPKFKEGGVMFSQTIQDYLTSEMIPYR